MSSLFRNFYVRPMLLLWNFSDALETDLDALECAQDTLASVHDTLESVQDGLEIIQDALERYVPGHS